jgi:hypothetical protein
MWADPDTGAGCNFRNLSESLFLVYVALRNWVSHRLYLFTLNPEGEPAGIFDSRPPEDPAINAR